MSILSRLTLFVLGVSLSAGCADASPLAQADAPRYAQIIAVRARGRTVGARLPSGAKLTELEAFFPSYRRAPSSPRHGKWDAHYEIGFRFPNGATILVRSNGKFWTCGDGDFDVEGDLDAFLNDVLPSESPGLNSPSAPTNATQPVAETDAQSSNTTEPPASGSAGSIPP